MASRNTGYSYNRHFNNWSLDDEDNDNQFPIYHRDSNYVNNETNNLDNDNNNETTETNTNTNTNSCDSTFQYISNTCDLSNYNAWATFDNNPDNYCNWDYQLYMPPQSNSNDDLVLPPLSPGSSQPSALTPSQSSVVTASETSSLVSSDDEYNIIDGDYTQSKYYGKLETHKNSNNEYYLRIQDIVAYVSRGATICDEYLSNLINYVNKNVEIKETISESFNTMNGIVYCRDMPKIKNHQYPVVAKYCLEWMVNNPEKVSMPKM